MELNESGCGEGHKHSAKKFRVRIKRHSFRLFPFWEFDALLRYPLPLWSIGIISLRGNVKLNLAAQSVAGKILISKSLGVDDGSFRLSLAPWKSSAFSLCAARADVTSGCGN
jgi:hypothetical protein